MTNIEQQAMNAVKDIRNDIRKYVSHAEAFRWEERRYEIAKLVMASLIIHGYDVEDVNRNAKTAINIADALIKELKPITK